MSTKIQSILFSRDLWTKKDALKWLDEHNKIHFKVDTTEHYFRFRQFDPNPDKVHRSLNIGGGIMFILEIH